MELWTMAHVEIDISSEKLTQGKSTSGEPGAHGGGIQPP